MTEPLRIERVIDAPPEVVFETFLTEDGQAAFYGQDDPGWIVESDCDLRVGRAARPARVHDHRPTGRRTKGPGKEMRRVIQLGLMGATMGALLACSYDPELVDTSEVVLPVRCVTP